MSLCWESPRRHQFLYKNTRSRPIDSPSSRSFSLYKIIVWMFGSDKHSRGRIFSHVRPLYEWAVSDLDRSMHRSLWVLVAHSSFIEGCHMTKNTASGLYGSVRVCHIFKFVKFLSLSNPTELCSDHFPGWQSLSGGINKDPTVWLEEDRQPPKYALINNMSLTNS